MTPEELVELFRLDVDDTDADDPLWSELEVYSYLDAAQKEFARKTDYFSDATTTAIVDVPINKIDLTAVPVVIDATHQFANLDPRITKIRGAKLLSTGQKIYPMTYAQMEEVATGDDYGLVTTLNWETSTGAPKYIVTDMERNKIRIAPMHTSNVASPQPADLLDTIRLQVYRLPLKDIVEGSAALEIVETDYQRKLLPYMKYLAYSKNDVDTMETELASAEFGKAMLIFAEVKSQLRRQMYSAHTGTVRYSGL